MRPVFFTLPLAAAALAGSLSSMGCAKATAAPQEPARVASSVDSGVLVARSNLSLAKRMLTDGAFALDVRTPGEFAEGHLEHAVLIPVDVLASRIDDLTRALGGDKSKPVVVYCRSGARAERAATLLAARGFTHVVNGGGFTSLAR